MLAKEQESNRLVNDAIFIQLFIFVTVLLLKTCLPRTKRCEISGRSLAYARTGPRNKDDLSRKFRHSPTLYTDKKENKIFLIYEEIQNGADAKSYMTNGLLIYGEMFVHFLIYKEALPAYDFATAPL